MGDELAFATYPEYLYILDILSMTWSILMKQFQARDLTRNTTDLWTAATIAPVAITKHRKARFIVMSVERYEALVRGDTSQVAISVANMPDDLGALFDKGVEDHFRDR